MKQLYTVYDLKAATVIGSIIQESGDAPAIRAFHDALNPKHQTVLSEHPEDFTLLCIGSMDSSGLIVAPEPGLIQTIATGAQWAAANRRDEA